MLTDIISCTKSRNSVEIWILNMKNVPALYLLFLNNNNFVIIIYFSRF